MNKRGHVLNAILLSVGIGIIVQPSADLETVRTITEVLVPVVLGALFPDVDTAFGTHRKTLHNLPVLGIVLAYPIYFANLQYVWIGVLTHYVLDVLGSRRGIALFYPLWDEEFNLPVGVPVSSKWATPMMLTVTAFELVVAAGLVYGTPPELQAQVQQVVGL
ncbi:metal-dependent hydrolase [Halapricum desulfuricans]|uniref:Membrane assocaited metal-dependent hydrolase n=1 Tax=Halapricum desulfuricans TaxID=2841257 RepID=A0A897N5V1_9EURY|nr:metal-dependent hydrolase [Halapricum desulfuricans]QSG08192.1 Membrane assocaited metal-dependent hydrolase [Halapricum desulfuricans]QSG12681.1 Membrane assocaited metal-dependent hydrolase [Halapricum desulfuricans]